MTPAGHRSGESSLVEWPSIGSRSATGQSRTARESRRQIIALLLEHGRLSRTELARLTGFNKPTMTNHVSGLLGDELVREVGSGVSTGGRRPILIELNADRHQIAGIEVDADFVRVLITNLTGDSISETTTSLRDVELDAVIDECANALDRAADGSNLLACGVALPGLVDRLTDTVDLPAPFNWHRSPFRQRLEARLNTPTYVIDRGKAAGLGEMWLLGDEPFNDLIYLYLGRGVGGAIVLGGKLHWGVGSIAGEIGHMVVDPDGPPCACGNRGCLESLVATAAIRARARQLVADYPMSSIDPATFDPAAVSEAVANDDPVALALIQSTARWVGLALASLVNVINPGTIVVGGPTAAWGEPFRREIERVVEQATLLPARQEAPIVLGRARERAPVLGAIALVEQHAPELLIPTNRVTLPAFRPGG